MELSLGIDTSNYKTSVAVVDENGRILCNIRKYLDVKKGERGLRQSVALFQHVNRLPELIEEAFEAAHKHGEVRCVSVSSRPRNIEGSYMPVFNAGISAGRSVAAALSVPYFEFSHQQGHIEAVKHYSEMSESEDFISFHFSGGTTEALHVTGEDIGIIGGTRDIAAGQVLDRVGVALGMEFPCGEEMDKKALAKEAELMKTLSAKEIRAGNPFTKIKCNDGFVNFSGIETQAQRAAGKIEDDLLIYYLFVRIAEAIADMTRDTGSKCKGDGFLYAGGVSSSSFIRKYLSEKLAGYRICFGDPALSTDNAVGTALLGGKKIWL